MVQRLTREAYHQWAAGRKARYELVQGEPVAMAPECTIHVRMKYRIWSSMD